mmetsp:Transcript_85190/g.237826  ORF Transcript_85190/g.237826 Transcript_85190/m.237826 type:complete len:256 (-) Transcript_85190:106-873(-)
MAANAENAEKRKDMSGTPAIMLLAVLLLTPAVVLAYNGYLKDGHCADEKGACEQACHDTWSEIERRFMSQNQGIMECIAQCNELEDTCKSTALLYIVGSLLLCAGLFCSWLLLGMVLSIMAGSTLNDVALSSKGVRPSISEPILTEADMRKDRAACRALAESIAGKLTTCCGCLCCLCTCWCRARFHEMGTRVVMEIGQKALVVPEEDEEVSFVKTKCGRCDVSFDVDARWLSGGMSGKKGSVCPKCREVVLGLL